MRATEAALASRGRSGVAGGFAGKILRVNLTTGKVWTDQPSERDYREYLGGVGLGAKIIYEEVPPEVGWDHPENRLVRFDMAPWVGIILPAGVPKPIVDRLTKEILAVMQEPAAVKYLKSSPPRGPAIRPRKS